MNTDADAAEPGLGVSEVGVEHRFEGPLETTPFPDALAARVVTPGEQPRVHGYDVENDLARNYDFVALFLLYLTGELPTPQAGAAARVALAFVSPTSVAHASVHATVLARLCGSPASALFGVAAIGLAEQARVELDGCHDLLEWLAHPTRPYPDAHRCRSGAEREAAARLLRALQSVTPLEITQHDPTRLALVLAVLRAAGLRRREQFEAAFAFARLPSALAEGFAERPTNFAHYPIHLPPIVYDAPERRR